MDKMRIMVIEDDVDLSELIRMYLIPEGWAVKIFNTGNEALNSFEKHRYDLILLDLLLPDINGFKVCKVIRENSTIPIIMLTALENSVHKVQGLNIGADDYITKPFEPTELIARIKSQFRRSYEFSMNNTSNKESFERIVGVLKLNKKTHQGHYGDISIELTPKEFDILWLLMGEPDNVHSMDDIHYGLTPQIWTKTH